MNITFSSLGKIGRLGNQLFQIASTFGLAKRYNATVKFPSWPYEKYFTINLQHGPAELNRVEEKVYEYHDWELKQSSDIKGYLQSEKYWSEFYDLKNLFQFKTEFEDEVRKKYFKEHTGRKTIGISIRRGDFVNNPNYAQLPISYYLSAINAYLINSSNTDILIFSDDIEYCKLHFESMLNVRFAEYDSTFNSKGKYFNENRKAIEQLCAGSICSHLVISNSTFSWWIAYLCEQRHGTEIIPPPIIVRPSKVLSGNLAKSCNTKDFYPMRWYSHENEARIDMMNVTFLIPVHDDHKDRRQNLSLNVCMLQKHIRTNIIIMEQGSNSFSHYSEYENCTYMKFEGDIFHRTAMLNKMAHKANTPIIVNWDADVFVSPVALYKAMRRILYSEANVVYPYDGRFARVPRTYFKALESALDIGIFAGKSFKGMAATDKKSVGGAIMFAKTAFLQGGGENENFVNYGPEDVEREVRFKKLGYKVERLNGTLYHMDHYRGPNSKCEGNPFDKQNHDELEKIYKLSPDELREYVNTWPQTKKHAN